MVNGAGRVRIGEDTAELKFTVPKGPSRAESLLAGAQDLANQVASLAQARVEQEGHKVSCAKGCGACCRQLVPISPTEARHLAAVVASLPPRRAAEVRKRFTDALAKLESADLPPRGNPDTDKPAYREFGLAYFRQGVPCPFLEEESCSIHPRRPLVCREYQVTSPPAACASLGAGEVRQVPVPLSVWSAFSRSASPDGDLEWMPLVEALRYAAAHPTPDLGRTGPERVQALLNELQR